MEVRDDGSGNGDQESRTSTSFQIEEYERSKQARFTIEQAELSSVV